MGFFDDLTKKATETYKNTAEKTNKLTREMKLKSQINDNKAKITKIYGDIGKKVYEKHVLGENVDIKTDLAEECAKIDAFSKEIEDLGTEIRALKGIRLCNKCGSEIMVNAKFCPKCGEKQEEIKVEEKSTEKETQNTSAETQNADIKKEKENTPITTENTVSTTQSENTNTETPVTEIVVKDEGVVEIKNVEE